MLRIRLFALFLLMSLSGASLLLSQGSVDGVSGEAVPLPMIDKAGDTIALDESESVADTLVAVDGGEDDAGVGREDEESDTARATDPMAGPDYPTLTPEEYRMAGGPRYTIFGTLPYRDTHVRPIPAVATGLVVTGMVAGIHFYQQKAWWSDRRTDFHFSTDWGYAAQADKLGHMYAGYITSYIGYEALVASGFSRETAGWFGPLLALGFQTYVEIEDGFSPFGFDPTDQYANTIGPLLFSLRNYIAPLQNLSLKWTYLPNDDYITGDRYGHETFFVTDYNGQTIWLSLKIGNILPDSFGWPNWLRLAAGYGAVNVDRWITTADPNDYELQTPGRRWMIALDYDMVELLPALGVKDLGTFGNWILQSLDMFHLPAPALQLTPEVKFYLMWPVTF